MTEDVDVCIAIFWTGKDATAAFDPIHPKDIVKLLPDSAFKGLVDPTTIRPEDRAAAPTEEASTTVPSASSQTSLMSLPATPAFTFVKPPLEHMLNTMDFETVARFCMKKEGWDYYASGADDEITLRENRLAFQRLWLRPRVLINVKTIDTTTKMLGADVALPIYITATALAKLAHPDGEIAITRAAHTHQLVYMCPTLASYSLDEMCAARQPGQTQWYQLYVNPNRKLTEDVVRKAERLGCTALCITVDAPQLGRREKDMRNKFTSQQAHLQKGQDVNRSAGVAGALTSFIDPSLCWADIAWLRSLTKMKLVLKGIQTGEDAVLAVQHGIHAIILSNHGGRQLDYARSAIEILPEVMEALRGIGADQSMEVYVDGGVRRGTDVVKALALGAKGVGIGRPILWALASYGQEGVERCLSLLKHEVTMAMALLGARSVSDLKTGMVMTRNISDHFVPGPQDMMQAEAYVPLRAAAFQPGLQPSISSRL